MIDTWNSPIEWVQFVSECIDDLRAGQRLFRRLSCPIIVIANRWQSTNAGAGRRTCTANDNG
jgi:hypothetical protein